MSARRISASSVGVSRSVESGSVYISPIQTPATRIHIYMYTHIHTCSTFSSLRRWMGRIFIHAGHRESRPTFVFSLRTALTTVQFRKESVIPTCKTLGHQIYIYIKHIERNSIINIEHIPALMCRRSRENCVAVSEKRSFKSTRFWTSVHDDMNPGRRSHIDVVSLPEAEVRL